VPEAISATAGRSLPTQHSMESKRLIPADNRSTAGGPVSRLADCVGLGLALLALLGMAAWSWGRLVEIQIDFGREIYLAWQLAEGKRL
jgi:hypothetical protein